jgi:enoyl-CoA hydratase
MTTAEKPMPQFKTIVLSRQGRQLTITLNRPDSMNAVNYDMHEELIEVMQFAAADRESDLLLLTGAGRAFSAGGDLDHLARNAANPELFDQEARAAKQIFFTMLDIDKPIVCRMNGHAVGLGATLALLSDVIFAADGAKIGDPHVGVGLVAGDGGAILWAHRIGMTRAKEYLLTGDLLTAKRAEEIGLINHCVAPEELDARVEAFCDKLLNGAMQAIRYTKILTNLELKRTAHAIMDAGIAYETLSVRGADHREAVQALREKRKPNFKGK